MGKSLILFMILFLIPPVSAGLFGFGQDNIIVASINLQEGKNINLNPSTITGFGTINLVDEPIIDGNLTINGDLILRDRILSVVDQLINASFLPSSDDQFDLGSAALRWMDGFFSGTVTAKTFSGNNSQWSKAGTNVFLTTSTDNVGIGTLIPVAPLNAVGSAFPVLEVERTTTVGGTGNFDDTTGLASGALIKTTTTANSVNGAGGGLLFSFEDASASESNIARIYARRDGADDVGALQLWTGTGGLSPRLTIRADGKVGIGTTSPSAKLHSEVTDSTSPLIAERTGGNPVRFEVKVGGNNLQLFLKGNQVSDTWTIATQSFGLLIAHDNGVTDDRFFTILENGNVGIGTIVPNAKLHVNYTGASQGVIFTRADFGTTGSTLFGHGSGGDPQWRFDRNGDQWAAGNNGGKFEISSSSNVGAGSEVMTLEPFSTGGHVGIGITNPTKLLHLVSSDNNPLLIESTDSIAGIALKDDSTTSDIAVLIQAIGDNLRFSANGVRMMILSDGNVGIGTSTPNDRLEIIGNVRISGSINASFANFTDLHIENNVVIEGKADIGHPGTPGGLDVGEGGSYTTNHSGVTIVQAFTYDASASSGSRFTEFTDLDASNTLLAAAGDRFYVCSQEKFWAGRVELSTAKGDEHLEFFYYDGNTLIEEHFMGILKDSATTLSENIWEQTTEKEYFTWDHEVGDNWTVGDDVTDILPDLTTDSYCAIIQNEGALATAPIITEIKVRGTDFDLITGTSYPVFWGDARIEKHERILLTVARSPGGTGTTNIDIDSAHQQTVFNFNGAGDNVAFIWTLPEALDTSSDIHVELDWTANTADTYNIDLSISELRNNTLIGSGIAPDFTQSTALVADNADRIYTGYLIGDDIAVHNLTSSDSLSFELQRTDASNAIYPLSIIIHYVAFSNGEIITAD